MARCDGRVFTRGNAPWIAYMHNGKEVRERACDPKTGSPTFDLAIAGKFLKARRDAITTERGGGPVFVTPKASKITVRELVDALEADYKLRAKDSPQNLSQLKRCKEDFGEFRAVGLTSEQIDRYIEDRLAKGAAKASINRTTQLVAQAFKFAIRRKRLTAAPHVRKLSEKDNVRKISVSETQLADFLAALPDDGLRDFAQWSAACGMRSGEAKQLTWQMLDGEELRIPGTICKNGDGRVIPVKTGELAEIIERRKQARRMDCQFVFHRDGKPVKGYRRSVATARRAANLPNGETAQERFVLHTLRSVAASNLIHAKVAPSVAMKVGGWRTDSMLFRYTILTTDDVRDALAQTETYRAGERTKQKSKVVSIAAKG